MEMETQTQPAGLEDSIQEISEKRILEMIKLMENAPDFIERSGKLAAHINYAANRGYINDFQKKNLVNNVFERVSEYIGARRNEQMLAEIRLRKTLLRYSCN